MSYDDTIERLAIAVASQIKTINDYHKVMNSLEKIKSKNMYAITMIDLVNRYTDKKIIEEFHREVDTFVNRILEKDESPKKPTSGLKKTSLLTKLLRIFKRR